jgi:hypothetical protein
LLRLQIVAADSAWTIGRIGARRDPQALSAEAYHRIIRGFAQDGLVHDEGGEINAAAGKPSQHSTIANAYGTGGDKRAVLFSLKTVAQARQAAADKGQDAAFGALMNRLRRIQYKITDVDAPIDSVELTNCLRSSGLPVESRMQLRTELFAAGLIEP